MGYEEEKRPSRLDCENPDGNGEDCCICGACSQWISYVRREKDLARIAELEAERDELKAKQDELVASLTWERMLADTELVRDLRKEVERLKAQADCGHADCGDEDGWCADCSWVST